MTLNAGSEIFERVPFFIYSPGLEHKTVEKVTSAIDIMLEIFANSSKTDAINGVFMAPKWLAPLSGGVLRDVAQSQSPATFNINVSKQTSLNGYSPRNNKLKCFPYNYLLISNKIQAFF